MSETPFVLIGLDRETFRLSVVGIYETKELAQDAVQSGGLPSAYYSLMTPAMNDVLVTREAQLEETLEQIARDGFSVEEHLP